MDHHEAGNFDPADWPRFVHVGNFDQRWAKLGLDDDDLRALEMLIVASGNSAPVVRGTGGVRKIRFADPRSGRGKSGSHRVYFADFDRYGIVLLATVFGKNERQDISPAEKAMMSGLIRAIDAGLTKGEIR